MQKNGLIILAGPSGVGKTPLDLSSQRYFPEIRNPLRKIILYNSRKPRPGEKDGQDYHFRSRKFLNQLRRQKEYIVIDVRGDIQAINLEELKKLMVTHPVIFEGNTYIALEILDRFKSNPGSELLSIFLSPVGRAEIKLICQHMKNKRLNHFISDLMYKKLERRTRKEGTSLSAARIKNLKIRSGEAYSELKTAWRFDFIIPNHDGEDSDHWDLMPYPIGDARITLHTFIDLLRNGKSDNTEKWEKDLIP